MIREQGWGCPKCGRVWAPKISACGYCNLDAKREPPVPPAVSSSRWNWGADDESYL